MAIGLGSTNKLYQGASLQVSDARYSPSNFSQLLLLQNIQISIDGEAIDVSTMDDLYNRLHMAGRRTITATFGGVFNHSGDTGFEIGETALLGATDAIRLIAYLLTSSTTGNKEAYFEAYPTNITYVFNDNTPSSFSQTTTVNTASYAHQDTT